MSLKPLTEMLFSKRKTWQFGNVLPRNTVGGTKLHKGSWGGGAHLICLLETYVPVKFYWPKYYSSCTEEELSLRTKIA